MKSGTFSSLSGWAVVIAIAFIATLRLTHVNHNETSWDVLGYYLPLPATFIYDDPMMDDRAWIEKINNEKQLSGTLYQVTNNEEGQPMYFFLFGMAIFYLPFFLAGHGYAAMTGAATDGFSLPYQYALVIGAIIYTLIGLILLRKILLRYYSERVSAIVILILLLATNYTHHLSYKNLETVNILFMLMCWLIWSTIRWHETHRFKHLLFTGIAITLMTLVKPSEVMAVFIPFLWSVTSFRSLKEKIGLFWTKRKQVIGTVAVCLLILSPQLLYWHSKTGHFIYDSYNNPGVGLDIFSPHILDVLFSFRKGWLIYTPVMILGLIGLFWHLRSNKSIGWSFPIYFLITFYIISSWTEWWYGGAYSCRPVITAYPILAIGLGAFLTQLKTNTIRYAIAGFVVLAAGLNLFQWWQLQEGIYDPYRTTKEYYWAIFLQTKAPPGANDLKLVERSFVAEQLWNDRERYRLVKKLQLVKGKPKWTTEEFTQPQLKLPYSQITQKDHAWVEFEVVYETTDSVFTNGPFLAVTAIYKDKAYAYKAPALNSITDTINGKLVAKFLYMTPEMRREDDPINSYIWNPGKNNLKITSYRVRFYDRKK